MKECNVYSELLVSLAILLLHSQSRLSGQRFRTSLNLSLSLNAKIGGGR